MIIASLVLLRVYAFKDVLGADMSNPKCRDTHVRRRVAAAAAGAEHGARARIGRRDVRGERLQWLRDAVQKRMAAVGGMDMV